MCELEIDKMFEDIVSDVMSGKCSPPAAPIIPKLTPIDTNRIKALKSNGYSFGRIAQKLNVDLHQVVSVFRN